MTPRPAESPDSTLRVVTVGAGMIATRLAVGLAALGDTRRSRLRASSGLANGRR